MLYTLNRKGEVIATGKGREDGIHTILPLDTLGEIFVYSKTRYSTFLNAHKKIASPSESSTSSAQYSLDGDGTFLMDNSGTYHVNMYNCDAPTTAIALCRLDLGADYDKAYAVVDDSYLDNLNTAEANKLPVYSGDTLIRTLKFQAPVIQVMSLRHWGKFKADEIYFLLRDGSIVRMTGSNVANKNIKDQKDLEKKIEIDDSAYPDDDTEEDASSVGVGFAVHGSARGTKIIFKGHKTLSALSINVR